MEIQIVISDEEGIVFKETCYSIDSAIASLGKAERFIEKEKLTDKHIDNCNGCALCEL